MSTSTARRESEKRRGAWRLVDWTRTVRGRSAVLAAVVVALALTVAAYLVLGAFERDLRNNLDDTLLQQVNDRLRLVESGTDPTALTDVSQEEAFVWIGRSDGTELAVSGAVVPLENPVGDVPELAADPAPTGVPRSGVGGAQFLVEERKPDETERENMILRRAWASSGEADVVVVAGAETESIDEPVDKLRRLFSWGIPPLVLLVGVLAWILAGRALAPVDGIRRRTLEIGGADLSDRVPVPDTRDEVSALATTMNDMLDRLEDRDTAIRRFTSDASHELRSPVANMRSLVETSRIDDAAWDELAPRLLDESDRLARLVDDLLVLATLDDPSARRFARVPVHLDDLAFDEAEVVRATRPVRLGVDGVAPVTVDGDPDALRRVVRNLLDNAARHAAGRVAIAVTETDDGDTAIVAVDDDGEGVPVERRDDVFERFARLDDSRDRRGGGSGLGLAIVRGLVEEHGGTVGVGESTLGGARFEVRLPVRRTAG